MKLIISSAILLLLFILLCIKLGIFRKEIKNIKEYFEIDYGQIIIKGLFYSSLIFSIFGCFISLNYNALNEILLAAFNSSNTFISGLTTQISSFFNNAKVSGAFDDIFHISDNLIKIFLSNNQIDFYADYRKQIKISEYHHGDFFKEEIKFEEDSYESVLIYKPIYKTIQKLLN